MATIRHRFTLWTALVVVSAVAIYGGAWWLVAGQVKTLSEQWIDDQRQRGWTISYAPLRVGGFPQWPQLEFEDLQVAAPLSDGGWVWTAEAATVVPAALDLSQISVLTPGRQTFRPPGQVGTPWTLTAFSGRTDLSLDAQSRLQSGEVTLGDMEILDPAGLPIFGAARVQMALGLVNELITPDAPYAKFSSSADAVRIAADTKPFTRSIPAFRLDLDLLGAISPGRLTDALNDWRTNGGTLEVRRFLLDWPPLLISADGTLALDRNLQPIAAFSTRISGFRETVDALVDDGQVSAGDAQSVMLVLNLLAQTPSDSGAPEITVPVSVQDRRLSVGPFNVMEVPEVSWE